MHSLKMQPFVPPAVQQTAGRKHLGYNLLIVGAQGVGKYCLHHQFVYACFPSIRDPFFDSERPQMLWKSDGNDKFAFQIQPTRMDISRPEDVPHFQHLYPAIRLPVDMYRLTDANGMMLVYNIDSRSSFDALTHFIEARNQDSKSDNVEPKVLCVVGNKLDKSRDKRKILCLEGEALASKLGVPYVECSAKDQKGLDKVKSTVIKSMETQRSQLQYAQQQRDRAAKGSRIFNQKSSLMRRLSGGSMSHPETQRSTNSNESNSSQQMTRNQRHRNGAIISPSGRYKGGLLASSLSSEDRIEEEDEETESDEISRSSSQQSSNTSTTSKQSSITITPPSNASSTRASFSHRLTIEKLPPAAIISLSPVRERPQDIVRSFSDLSSYTSTGMLKQKSVGLSITSPEQVSSLSTLFQQRRSPKDETKDATQTRSHDSSAASSRVQSPQNMYHAQSLPTSRVQSPELVDYAQSRNFHDPVQPVQPFQLPQLEFFQPLSPTSDEKRKLEEERAQLEEEKEKLRQEMQELEKHQIRLEERRRVEAERRAIEEERKKIVEERKRVEEERQNLKEAKRLMEEEESQWRYQQNFPWEKSAPEHSQTPDEQFRGLSPKAEFRDDARQEEIRRHHQEQLQQEQQRDLQLKSVASSPSSAYSVQREFFSAQGTTALPAELHSHPLQGNPISTPTSPHQRPMLLSRSSLRSTTSARREPRAELAASKLSAQNDGPPITSPPGSPDITQTFRRRLLGKKEPKKEPSKDQRETLKFLRDELGITIPQLPASGPPPRSPRLLLLPPATTMENNGNITQTERQTAEAKPKLPFPGRYM